MRRCRAFAAVAGRSIRLDGDTYEATWVGLDSLYPGLSAGGYLIIDDYGLIKECRCGRRRLPPRARDHRADREGRLERGPLAARGRA